ncbi:MAG: DUF2924 domain-containing protein [Deltaproteobacteria bacterium]|nr:DUF2924 domain-containing protein [Deltaproteobacteria bacterium]
MSKASLDSLLADICSLSYQELKERYQASFGQSAPPRLGGDLQRRALAYRAQADDLGGLPRRIEKLLRTDSTPAERNGHQQLLPGTQLVREWQGEMHVVDVLEHGYGWRGEKFTSLSAVAREITGTRWSGPRFFGLTGNGKP